MPAHLIQSELFEDPLAELRAHCQVMCACFRRSPSIDDYIGANKLTREKNGKC